MTKIRSFLAIPLPTELQQRLGSLQQDLKRELPELRPLAPENLHLSLLFLGDQPQEELEKIGDLMLAIGAICPSFTVALKGLGSFPGGRRPRVVWLGVEPPEQLRALQAVLVEGLCALGLPRETRPYRPHLTLGRLRRPLVESGILGSLRGSDCGRLEVKRMVLFSSRLTPQGAVHRPLREVALSGAGGIRS